MHDQGALNLAWSEGLLEGVTASGVVRAVISPGGRSTPLVLACERAPRVETHVVNDERSAAFFALGIAKENRLPTLVIATSGSAAAHWHPAVIEAYQGGIPLLLLSADRPPELQDWGFNQTTDQHRLFGPHVKAFHDPGPPVTGVPVEFMRALGMKAAHQALSPTPGPVHINLPFREPLTPVRLPAAPVDSFAAPLADYRNPVSADDLARVIERIGGAPGAIVCGPGTTDPAFPSAITRLAHLLRAPIFADPLSGLRFGPHDKTPVLSRYDTFLDNPKRRDRLLPRWIMRFGAPPVSKALNEYLRDSAADTILVNPGDRWLDPTYRTAALIPSDPTLLCEALIDRGEALPDSSALLEELLSREGSISRLESECSLPLEAGIIRRTVDRLSGESLLFCSNSLPVRQVDTWSGLGTKPLRITGNRGISGIDGNLSTLHGMASAGDHPVVGLIGDQAFFHDISGLHLARESRAIIVVLNNRGGRIFSRMPLSVLPAFEKYWTAPMDLEIEAAAGLYGRPFRRVADTGAFSEALAGLLESADGGVIEVTIDPGESLAVHRDFLERSRDILP